MIEKQLTFDDIKTAYRKLKSISYYDTHGLFLKSQIAHFETKRPALGLYAEPHYEYGNFEEKLEHLYNALISDGEHKEYWNKLYEQINFKVLPKKIKSYKDYQPTKPKKNEHLIESIFTNVREIDDEQNYEFERLTFFFDAPIEIHLVSILWIMKLGFHLESDLQEKCYGNRLILQNKKANSNEKRVTDDLGLFKPYYKQYQKWRDEGITVAKDFLENKQDVLFLNIDIKDYYYSIRLNFKDLDKRLDNYQNEYENLVSVFKEIHFNYSNKLKGVKYPNDLIKDMSDNESILPIGLASSYILANWYLNDFDSRVHSDIRPIYYSRYVDDIFIITANTNPEFTSEDLHKEGNLSLDIELQSYPDSLSIEEKHIIKTLYPVITLVETPQELLKIDKKIGSKIFKIQGYRNLYIQPSKTLVYFFEHDSSLALLDKFKNEIEERSSEFRFLPDEKLAKNGFDDEAYELVFEDSQHKVKTLKDYRENRYGIASHLSKKIFYSLRNGKTDNSEDAKKIIKFFKGTNNLEHFTQWERLLTYFVVNENKDEFLEFSINTLEQIYRLPNGQKFKKYNIGYEKIISDLLEHLSIAMEMALALNPSFYRTIEDRIVKVFNRFYEDFKNSSKRPLKVFGYWKRIRLSNMLRHNYVNVPMLNYTKLPIGATLLETDFSKIDMDTIDFEDILVKYSPRKVRFCEAAWMECIKRVNNTAKVHPFQNMVNNDLLFNENESNRHYLDDAYEVYFKINYPHRLADVEFKGTLKDEIFEYHLALSNIDEDLVGHEISVNQDINLDKLRVGLANMKVDKKNYEDSMLGKPKIHGRYLQFAKVLNEAESENCDMVILPELCLPHGLVKTIMEESWNHERAIMTGIEHWTHNEVAYNFILTLLPCQIRGVKDTVPILRLKNHYSPSEGFWINEYRRIVPKPKPYRYHLLRWKGLYLTNYYCFELADIVHRSIFRSKIDLLIASEWNRDTNFFSNITEVTSRDLHCYFIQVNTSDFGDSRVTHPKKTESKDSLRIKGGLNTGLLVDELDIKSLRKFQYKGFGLQRLDKDFKPTPASYKHDDARVRQENKSFRIE